MSVDTYTDLEHRRAFERDFPEWSVWRATGTAGELGDWYASRRRRITPRQMRAGLWATVHAASPKALRELLTEQTEIASRTQ
ncbi:MULTISPECIES: hypothetical protein [unclassified Microbispora]|uniref:hypothetical protein n=1 Tax=unclassified Microbispora TaxID=2614687 RepID=UPI00163BC370|nr:MULTISPECIES: hypothetical protein [unclassified Microbispora]